MKTIREKHSLPIRLTHWANFPLLFLMIWSGLLIYWANDVYRPFFPHGFYSFFHIDHRLAEGMAVHFSVLVPFTLNGLIYVTLLLCSGEWRELIPGATRTPKFNPIQRLAYLGVILMGALAVLSGIAIYKPVQLGWLDSLFGGYEGARLAHFLLTLAFVAFTLVHIVQVARAGFNNFRSMVAGFEPEDGGAQ